MNHHGGMPMAVVDASSALVRQDPIPSGCVVSAHGFSFAAYPHPGNAIDDLFTHGDDGQGNWPNMVPEERGQWGFSYDTVPQTIWHIIGSWASLYRNRYARAWHRAEQASVHLRALLSAAPGPVSIICHSLGTYTVLRALAGADRLAAIKRVVLINGAAHADMARAAAAMQPQIEFYNVCSSADRAVLGFLGGLFSPGTIYSYCIGYKGLGPGQPDNWLDLQLEAPDLQTWAAGRGWAVSGDHVGRVDHWTYRLTGVQQVVRAILADEIIDYAPSDLRSLREPEV